MKKNKFVIVIIGIMMLSNSEIKAQVDVLSHTWSSGFYVGWNSTNSLDFKINGTQHMIIDGSANPGFVGLGTTSPLEKFQVVNGNIDVYTSTNKFMINRSPVLWHNGITSNIFVGVGAGNGSLSGTDNVFVGKNTGIGHTTGYNNTIVGSNAGVSNITGWNNCFIGHNAGVSITNGISNVFIGKSAGANATTCQQNIFIGESAGLNSNNQGDVMIGYQAGMANTGPGGSLFIGGQAGFSNLTGAGNQFIGDQAGYSNTIGSENTFSGSASGFNNIDGKWNSFYGYHSGINNSSGNRNSFFGLGAGNNVIIGDDNTFVGYAADEAAGSNVNNSSAIGANSVVATDNTMILGNNDVNVGIGLSGNLVGPLAKLHVQRDLATNPPVLFPVGIYTINSDISSLGPYMTTGTGVSAVSNGRNKTNVALSGEANGAIVNFGTYSTAFNPAQGNNFGGYFEADGATNFNYAVHGNAPNLSGVPTIFNVGIYGNAPGLPFPSPQPPVGTGSYAGYFNGDAAVTGNLWFPSDSIIKNNIQPLTDASAMLIGLNSYSYNFNSSQFSHINFSKAPQFGFLANELEAVAPHLVINSMLPPELDSLGNVLTPAMPIKMVNYIGIIPILVAGFKELKEENIALMSQIANCCNLGERSLDGSNTPLENTTQIGSIELENIKGIQMEQNDPNPFDASTIIRWNINQDFQNAVIYFYDKSGNRINIYEINEKGYGELQVFGSKLSSGIYTYTLVVDGKIIDSKKMLRAY